MSNPKFDPKKEFTSNEVRALVEDLKSEFRAVAEGVTGLDERLSTVESHLGRIEEDVHVLKNDMATVKTAIQTALPDLSKRVTKLEAKIGA